MIVIVARIKAVLVNRGARKRREAGGLRRELERGNSVIRTGKEVGMGNRPFDLAAMWMSSHRGTRSLMFLNSLSEERLASIRGAALGSPHFVTMRPRWALSLGSLANGRQVLT